MLLLQKHLCPLPDEGNLKEEKRWTPGSSQTGRVGRQGGPQDRAWKLGRGAGAGLPSCTEPVPGHPPGGFAPYTDGYLM